MEVHTPPQVQSVLEIKEDKWLTAGEYYNTRPTAGHP